MTTAAQVRNVAARPSSDWGRDTVEIQRKRAEAKWTALGEDREQGGESSKDDHGLAHGSGAEQSLSVTAERLPLWKGRG